MQINSNTVGYTNAGTNSNFQRIDNNADRRAAAKPLAREAIKPQAETPAVIDQNTRGAQLAKNAYNGASQRGSIVNILV